VRRIEKAFMADIRAFRGFRYDLGRAGALSELVAPPYDVVGPALQQALYERGPYNAIRLELAKERPGDTETDNRYHRAALDLKEWLAQDVLRQDSLRHLYVCEQEFTVEGKSYRRRGFIARVRLEPFGVGRIFPHEETLSGPKADRLRLFHATNMNLSPIFGLYPDEENEVFAKIEPLLYRSPPLEATDHLGVVSRLWPIADERIISGIVGLMGPKPVFIADGHHRYETGLRYLEERKAAGEVANDEAAPNFTMMMLVSMSDPGLIILPTHRLLSGLPDLTVGKLRQALEPHFLVEMIGNGDVAALETWEQIEMDGSQALLGFHTNADDAWMTARFQAPQLIKQLADQHSDDWRDLAVSVLHVVVLGKLLGGTPQCRYVHLLSEVREAIQAKECQLAALVPPATMGHVERIAGNREKMPPKSTYFYPKLLTGLVFNSLKVN
jgi:uncharacterized protein (DUF1015 family)